jgi:hypothetical protein
MAKTAATGLNVWISANGKSCKEFSVVNNDATLKTQDEKVTSKYIQTVPDALFEIHIRIATTYPHHIYDLCATVSVAGTKMETRLYRRGMEYSRSRCAKLVINGFLVQQDGRTMLHKFKFHRTVSGKFFNHWHNFAELITNVDLCS